MKVLGIYFLVLSTQAISDLLDLIPDIGQIDLKEMGGVFWLPNYAANALQNVFHSQQRSNLTSPQGSKGTLDIQTGQRRHL